ncbi:MAG: DUF1501 domain-containing protein [Gammaproteobacteria bacterium]
MKKAINRRQFCARVGGSLALGALPASVAQAACAQSENTLVVLFLRGGADGLSLVVPRGDEASYVARRGNIAIPEGGAELELDGFFELHPSLAPFKSLYDSGEMAMVHAMGGANDYSHFTAQDSIERVMPGSASQSTPDGWLNRALGVMAAQGDLCAPNPFVNGVSIGSFMTKALAGPEAPFSVAFPEISSVAYGGNFALERGNALTEIFGAQGGFAGAAGQAAFGAIDTLQGLASQPPGVSYPAGNGPLNRALQDAARLIKNPDLGVRMITVNNGGWDHHSNLLTNIQTRGAALGTAVKAFWEDIGAAKNRTCLLIVTEFGRTAAVNGNGGTDHGWGNAMFALSGAVAGGRVLTRGAAGAPGSGLNTPSGVWPGLALDQLHVQGNSGQPRDLQSTTDFRDVFGEVLTRFMGVPEAAVSAEVLRGYAPQYPGLFV